MMCTLQSGLCYEPDYYGKCGALISADMCKEAKNVRRSKESKMQGLEFISDFQEANHVNIIEILDSNVTCALLFHIRSYIY